MNVSTFVLVAALVAGAIFGVAAVVPELSPFANASAGYVCLDGLKIDFGPLHVGTNPHCAYVPIAAE